MPKSSFARKRSETNTQTSSGWGVKAPRFLSSIGTTSASSPLIAFKYQFSSFARYCEADSRPLTLMVFSQTM